MTSRPVVSFHSLSRFLLAVTLLLLVGARQAFGHTGLADTTDVPGWHEITTVDDVWRVYPERLRILFGALELSRPGLEAVRTAVQAGDTAAAGEALVAYYRQSDSGHWLRSSSSSEPQGEVDLTAARRLVGDTVSFGVAPTRVPRRRDGGLNWSYLGPENDKEFGYSLNGLTYLPTLLDAWRATDQPVYAETFDRLIRDWTIHNPLPAKGDSIYMVKDTPGELGWRDLDEVRWRDLEAGQRLGESWPHVFYGFQQAEAFTPAARLLMLASIPEQATYVKNNHKVGHNWTTMEMNGLSLVGLAFPEFTAADTWANYALDVMLKELSRQVYPDGVQTELSTKTHRVALTRFRAVAENFRVAGRSVPAAYVRRLEDMHGYLAFSMRPDGYQPLNNDTDRRSVRERVLVAADTYDRPDWRFVATNGASGERPEGRSSQVFPWAGIHVMRSGWDEEAHWAFFDTGPFGTGHQHADKLHLSIAAYGRDLLVDGGRYTHQNYWSFDPWATWRGYFRSTHSHNTLLIDGHGQYNGERGDGPGDEETEEVMQYLVAEEPMKEGVAFVNTETFDYARGRVGFDFSSIEGRADHTRAVVYVRNRFWVVVDRVETDRPRRVEALWHYAPHCTVELADGQGGPSAVSTDVEKGNLRIVPAVSGPGEAELTWAVRIVKGQEEPHYQGWYSAEYGVKGPAPTVVYRADEIEGPATFVWVLVPAKGAVPAVKAEVTGRSGDAVRVHVEKEGAEPVVVTVPLGPGPGAPSVERPNDETR